MKNINISDYINNAKLSGYQILVITLCGIIAVLDGFDTQSIAFVAPVIVESWGLETTDFAIVFAVGILGLVTGSMVLGPLADRYGRKNIILLCLLIIGVLSLLTVKADSISDLLIFRFLTGIGLGGAIPNILALTAEYTPKRVLSTTITIMFCGFPLGAVLGGLVMSRIIPVYGWEIVFYIGGILPLLLLPIIFVLLPESIRFMVSKDPANKNIAVILKKINPSIVIDKDTRFSITEQMVEKARISHLFKDGLGKITLLLWIIYFMNLLIFYSLVNWLPSILKMEGIPIEQAIISTAIFNLGGVIGGIVISRLIDKWDKNKILSTCYILAAIFIISIGFLASSTAIVLFLVFFAGVFVSGTNFGVQAYMAGLYSTPVRSTGIGWAMGIGRTGGIVGPMALGMLLAQAFSLSTLFIIWAIPAVIAAIAMANLKAPRKIEKTNVVNAQN